MPYLSPESLPAEVCTITITIPNDELLRLAVMGQVYELSRPSLWELFGAVTPAQAAEAMYTAYNNAQYCEPPPMALNHRFQAVATANQNINATAATKIVMSSEDIDTDSWYDHDTSRFTPLQDGTYWVYASCVVQCGFNRLIEIRKNTGRVAAASFDNAAATSVLATLNVTAQVDMNGTTDFIELWGLSDIQNATLQKTSRRAIFGAYQIA